MATHTHTCIHVEGERQREKEREREETRSMYTLVCFLVVLGRKHAEVKRARNKESHAERESCRGVMQRERDSASKAERGNSSDID